MHQDELRLLQQKIAQDSDQQAYQELYRQFFERLYRFALSMVRTAEPAEEIVSDVFIKVWQHRARLGDIENLPVYLYVSVKNFSLNYLSKKAKEIVTYFEDYEAGTPSVDHDPEQLFITSEMVKRIEQAIQDLPPRCRMVFTLIKEDGLKYREAAAVLGISVKTAEAQIAIALKKIGNAISLDTVR